MAAKYAVCESDSGGLEVAEKSLWLEGWWFPGPTEDLGWKKMAPAWIHPGPWKSWLLPEHHTVAPTM